MKRVLVIIGVIVSLYGGNIIKDFHFSISDFKFYKIDGYDYIIYEGTNLNETGKPSLPYKDVYFLLPPSAEIVKVNIISKEEEILKGEYNIYPAQRYFPLSHPEIFNFIPPDKEVYSSKNIYPKDLLQIYPSGSKSGFRIQGIRIYPLRYIPAEKKLILLKNIEIEIIYEENKHEIISLTETQFKEFAPLIEKYVINPEDILRFSPPIKSLKQNEVHYAIITSDAFSSSFNSLKEWRTKQGYITQIFTTTWIYNNYTGYDNQEKIRNFIKDYFTNHGLIFVLLGGDANIVPVRRAYLPYYGDSYIATDLYYADLNGTWDADGDHLYGEMLVDGVDIYADVFVGRLPARTVAHIEHFLDKIFTYEKNPPSGYQKRVLLPSVMLFSQWGWHGREVNNAISDSLAAGSTGWTFRKLEDPASTATRDSFSHGFNFCHGAAHGDQNGWYYQTGSVVFVSSHIPNLTNGTKYTIVNAIACYSGDFDEYTCCFAESLLTKYPSGAVATIMNTRYGWGSYSGFGPSELLDIKFYSHFAKRDIFLIGKAHFKAKDSYRNNMLQDTVWAYCGYELTLFGDPAMPMWESGPLTMTVEHPSIIPLTTYDVEVNVKTIGGQPLQNALVCLYKPNEVHVKGYTNSQGQIILTVSPQTLGDMYITVTAKDHLPYEGVIQVVSAGMPQVPTVISPLDFARMPGLNPTLRFYSVDPQNEGIEYRVKWSLYPDFSVSDSFTTSVYPSGQVV
ncbi:MAG: C25 family cysteine peptidase, partial [candidate division WOR-3 bacterium]